MATYTIGYLLAPQSDDPQTDSEADARETAVDATKRDDRLVLGVWRDGTLVYIAHEGELWAPLAREIGRSDRPWLNER